MLHRIVAVTVAVALAGTVVFAHLAVKKSLPGKGAILTASPSVVQVWFTQEPEFEKSGLTLTGPQGAVALDPVKAGPEKSLMATVPAKLAAGAYTLADNAGQACAGAAAAASSSLADGFWPTLYAAPVAPGRVSTARPGQLVEISTAKLLALASDEDGDTLTITAASAASTRGGTVALAGGVIRYTAPAGFSGLDSFAYTVTDSGGDVATGWVTLSALAPASPNFISAIYASGPPPSMILKYAGIPGVAYVVQVSTDLASWATVEGSRAVVPASGASAGVASFVHENPPNPTAYYRTVQSP